MKAKDVMTPNVVTVHETTAVDEIARTLLNWRISAVPVIDDKEQLVGIVSEGDLVRRVEIGSERPPPWCLSTLADPESRASDYVKSHGQLARDVMSKTVVTVDEETTAAEIAQLLEENGIKRVPVLRRSTLVGIVSRANLLHGLAAARSLGAPSREQDRKLRASILNRLHNESDINLLSLNVTVADGVAHLWGTAMSEAQKEAIRIAAESTPGVSRVSDHLTILPQLYRQWVTHNQ